MVVITRVADSDTDPHYFLKLDPDPHKSQNSKASEAQNRAVDAHNGGLEVQNGALEGLETCGRRFLSL